ncbi:MAG: AraC family transcriptional regulator [Leeuwenhoekiella sp.]
MNISSIPEIYIQDSHKNHELLVYDLKMDEGVTRSKVTLSMHMFSFLQEGKKQVYIENTGVSVHKKQSLLIKKGNALWTESLEGGNIYYCKLLFFSEDKLSEFMRKHDNIKHKSIEKEPFFIIENDSYIANYLQSLSAMGNESKLPENLLGLKFEELLLYLIEKYGSPFLNFLQSLSADVPASFREIVVKYRDTNLKVSEIAFLCHMSLSSFKRHFKSEFDCSPGRWLQNHRLEKAKKILESGEQKPSDIYREFGYNNLSNFSTAFKNTFGINPSSVYKKN